MISYHILYSISEYHMTLRLCAPALLHYYIIVALPLKGAKSRKVARDSSRFDGTAYNSKLMIKKREKQGIDQHQRIIRMMT